MAAVVALMALVSIGYVSPSRAEAAVLSIAPSDASATYTVGQVFSVPVLVSTVSGIPVNAVSGTISFPTNSLQVVSLDTSGTFVDFWISKPVFSNSEGTINFEGGSYNPGFLGSGGKIVNILFKAKAVGPATVSFLSSAALANDGRGTNILIKANPATLNIVPSSALVPDVANTVESQALSAYSPTHPDQTKWYNLTTAKVAWRLPTGTTAVRTRLDRSPSTIPSIMYSPPISEKEVEISSDGVWYFHVQARNDSAWGPVTHYKLQIDTTSPDPFSIEFPHGSTSDDPRPVILFNTTDGLSGMSHYDVVIGDLDLVHVDYKSVDSNPYAIPDQDPGDQVIKVVAYDVAGNAAIATSTFTITGLKQPEFDAFPEILTEGDSLQFLGTTYPYATLVVTITDSVGQPVTQEAVANSAGRFIMIWQKYLNKGLYTMTSHVVDERGAKSVSIDERLITVRPPALTRIGVPILNYMTFLAIVIGGIAAIVLWSWYLLYHVRKLNRKLSSRLRAADESVHTQFKKLQRSVSQQVKALEAASERRTLTPEESRLIDGLRDAIDEAEEVVEREVKDIGK